MFLVSWIVKLGMGIVFHGRHIKGELILIDVVHNFIQYEKLNNIYAKIGNAFI